jgi:5-carboxymethyl-2-hydroxymuconic-semialdehyde dehydrogenase
VAPALAAGCTIVLKVDEWAPLPAAVLAAITTTAGLPDGVLNIVHGSLHRKAPGPQARDALIAHPSVARLSFAGEAEAGQEVRLEASTRGKNLAGDSPCLIFADADLDRAINSALFGGFALGGQRRTATSTILAETPVYESIVARLAERADRIRVGDPSDLERARRLAPAIESASTWVNSHNPRDRRDGGAGIDFFTRSRTVHVAAEDTAVPRFGA